ncbi:LAFA_0A00650g1_1 [Lachancea sp. 'fantastica']|nr:LAFA_0A00650g1_1 [Lachancea sp. 'fantastica']
MSNSDFDNWEPVDDSEEHHARDDRSPSESSATLMPSENNTSDQHKMSRSPIRSLQNSSRNSITSVDNTGLKSSPADPQLTALDPIAGVNSPSSKNGSALNSVNQIIGSSKEAKESKELPIPESEEEVANNSFFNNMLTSFNFKGSASTPAKPLTHSRASSESGTQALPNIISHRKATPTRKSRRSISNESNVPTSPLREMEKPDALVSEFNRKLYVDERFSGTSYHYAIEERNAELHKIFKSVPDGDRLLDDFSCALSREFLFQGRVYVTEANICFNSNLLGWVTHIVISMTDIILMEKTSTAGLFPNGISIETRLGKHQFVSFISRDTTFEFIKTVWQKYKERSLGDGVLVNSTTESSNALGKLRRSYSDLLATTLDRAPSYEPPSRSSIISENDAIIEDAILSVDDIIPTIVMNREGQPDGDVGLDDDDDDDYEDDDSDEDGDGEDEELRRRGAGSGRSEAEKGALLLEKIRSDSAATSISSLKSRLPSDQKAFKFKPDSGFEYDGPRALRETQFAYEPEKNNEMILADKDFNAPPGVIFQLIFSEGKPDFLVEFLTSQNSSNFSAIGAFERTNENGEKYREYTYSKALNFSVGPKSTKCEVSETLLNLDYNECINVVNATKTPDVPSGNSFVVKTRYMLRWASESTCNLKVSFWIEWTGGSWIKSMIEKSCKAGQVQATDALIILLEKYVQNFVTSTSTASPTFEGKRKKQSKAKRSIDSVKDSEKPVLMVSEAATVIPSATTTPQTEPFFPSFTNVLLFVNIVLFLCLIWRQERIFSLVQRSVGIQSAESVAAVDQMLSHFKSLFDADADDVLPSGSGANKNAQRYTLKSWIDKHSGNEEALDFNLHKKRQYQRYMRYIVDQVLDEEMSVSETEDFLSRLNKLMTVVKDTKKKSGNVDACELQNALNYLINA